MPRMMNESSDWTFIRMMQEDLARRLAEQQQTAEEARSPPYAEFCGLPDTPECKRTGRCMRAERTGFCCAD